MVTAFRYAPPATRISFGAECSDQIGADLKRSGCQRAVILSGHPLSNADIGVGTVKAALGDLCAGTHAGVAEHSPVEAVQDFVTVLRDLEADAVIVLGGGSAVVTARAATIMLGEGKQASELCTVFEPGQPPRSPRLAAQKLPQFIIPTTPTTAYAKAGAAVLAGMPQRRLSLFDPTARAQGIFFDPRFFAGTPARLFRDAALDAFCAAIQGLESKSRHPISDAFLLQGVRLIKSGLIDLTDGDSLEGRSDLMLASLMVGHGTDVSAGGLASAIGHSVGSRFGVANGLVNAVMLPIPLRFPAEATGERLDDLAFALGVTSDGSERAQAIACACTQLFAQLGLPSRLSELGVAETDLPSIAEAAARDWFYTQNPRPVTPESCLSLLEQAW